MVIYDMNHDYEAWFELEALNNTIISGIIDDDSGSTLATPQDDLCDINFTMLPGYFIHSDWNDFINNSDLEHNNSNLEQKLKVGETKIAKVGETINREETKNRVAKETKKRDAFKDMNGVLVKCIESFSQKPRTPTTKRLNTKNIYTPKEELTTKRLNTKKIYTKKEQSFSKLKRKNREEEEGYVRKCSHCEAEETPQWREGPLGPKTLCNACGVRYKSGRLVPEYRPAASPTFDVSKYSNFHKKILRNKGLDQK
ncbi:GATA transcription factor 11 [Quercus suber]|uniref:Gata transcription factor 2 n=1 Tax=Quercus suber TaxID=58331 RepID=A0AAW0LRZ9_QUESU|nr:GATA transcription factor 11-like [Quercus suber]